MKVVSPRQLWGQSCAYLASSSQQRCIECGSESCVSYYFILAWAFLNANGGFLTQMQNTDHQVLLTDVTFQSLEEQAISQAGNAAG